MATKAWVIREIRTFIEDTLYRPNKGLLKTRKRDAFIEICVMRHTLLEAAKRVYASELDPYVILEDMMWDQEAYMYQAHQDKAFMFEAAYLVLSDLLAYLYTIDPDYSEEGVCIR